MNKERRVSLKDRFVKWYDSKLGQNAAYELNKKDSEQFEKEYLGYESIQFEYEQANQEERVKSKMFSSEMFYAVPNPYQAEREHFPYVVMKGEDLLENYDVEDLKIDFRFQPLDKFGHHARWNSEFRELMQEDATATLMFKRALENRIIIPVIETDEDELEEEFQEIHNTRYQFSFGAFYEWELMYELNIKYYKHHLELFRISMLSNFVYFYDEKTGMLFRKEE